MLRRLIHLMLLSSLLVTAARAANDPLVGDWKLNPARSTLIDVMKIESLGQNKYSFDFGGSDPLIAVANGTDQPGSFGIMIAVTKDAPDQWTVVRRKDGKALVTGVWNLSKDGNTLNDHFTSVHSDGTSTTVDYVYKREGTGSGFTGKWVSSTQLMSSAVVLKIRPWQGNGLSIITQGGAGTKNLKLDGNDYANVGAQVNGQTASALRVSQRTVRLTDKFDGKILDSQEMTVSTDGKTLNVTVNIQGRTEADVEIFEKQQQDR